MGAKKWVPDSRLNNTNILAFAHQPCKGRLARYSQIAQVFICVGLLLSHTRCAGAEDVKAALQSLARTAIHMPESHAAC